MPCCWQSTHAFNVVHTTIAVRPIASITINGNGNKNEWNKTKETLIKSIYLLVHRFHISILSYFFFHVHSYQRCSHMNRLFFFSCANLRRKKKHSRFSHILIIVFLLKHNFCFLICFIVPNVSGLVNFVSMKNTHHIQFSEMGFLLPFVDSISLIRS